MLRPSKAEIEHHRRRVMSSCQIQVTGLLDFGKDLFHTMFPKVRIISTHKSTSTQWPTKSVLDYKTKEIKQVIANIFQEVINTCEGEEYELYMLPVLLPPRLGELVIDTCLKIQTFGRDLTDLDYYLLHDLGEAFGFSPAEIYSMIEQNLYETRKRLFKALKPFLSEEQREVCALLLLKAIRADNKVHPAEIKYFEIVSELLDHNQARLEWIESESDHLEQRLPIILTDDIAEFLFKYLVEIVMCDKSYDPDESLFIKEIAKAFNLDQTQQDMVIQPVAASLMVKSALFQQ